MRRNLKEEDGKLPVKEYGLPVFHHRIHHQRGIKGHYTCA
ncbi:hypothetical protein BSM4216_1093 [Bacillus smithii]|nr:hypothetical protein BSM4216_1093 [Bacillus smithii]